MNIQRHHTIAGIGLIGGLVIGALPPAANADPLTFTPIPLFLASVVNPNVLVVFDNSQSMDGTMAGKLIAGDDASTRGNIARSVLSSTITTYRSVFNWGLESFELSGSPGYYYTYAYYFGSDAEVLFTNDCVNGLSASNGGLRCVGNPESAVNGYNFITYGMSGDDPSINDVLYIGGDYGAKLYGIGGNGQHTTDYDIYTARKTGSGTGWNASDFNTTIGAWGFTPTDAGFLPQTPPNRRMFWLKRAWGYNNNITGNGKVNQAVAADSSTQYNALMALLAPETSTAGSSELKNAAVFTPLAGALATAKKYFSKKTTTPISLTCQKNFVLLATDGNPTGKTNGDMYTLADQKNTYDSVTNTWTFSTAANDVFNNITALRSTSVTGTASVDGTYDIQSYVIGLGDSVANASSIAALNKMASLGGGNSTAYLASNVADLKSAFQQISSDIVSKTSAASAVSLNSGSWNTGSEVFQARFARGDWSGQLLALSMNESGTLSDTPLWDAGQLLNGLNWDTGRQILTYKASASLGNRGIAFRWPADSAHPTSTEMDSAMVSALNTLPGTTADSFGNQRLSYLRGNAAREARNCTTCSAPVFRNRATSVLGDIVNSAPVYVSGATGNFRDTIESVPYSTFAATRATAAPMIFVGANDGMLHGFNGTSGAEVFAYVPWAVRSKLSTLTDPAYTHQYTTDGSPTVGDAFYDGHWHSVLVSGMNAGASGLFALDVTTPANFTEANAKQVVRWEIDGSDADVGYIFSQPVVAKMKNGRWMAIVGNGYNSTNGHAVLLLVDVETGAITRIDTGSGSASSANGLSGVVAISSANNGVADIVYAGDLAGNMWKFDLSSTVASSWKVAYGTVATPQPLFTTASGQSITARPDVTLFPKGGYLVAFGTGRYVDVTDNNTSATQALYGIWDKGTTVSMSDLQSQSVFGTAIGVDSRTYRVSTHAVDLPGDGLISSDDNTITLANYYASKKGWVINLPTSGERIVGQATIRFGKVIVSTLIPNTAPCAYGGDGWIMELDFATGNRLASSLDTTADNNVDDNDPVFVSGVTTGNKVVSGVRVGSIPAPPGIIRSKNRKLDDKLVNTSVGTVLRARETGSALNSGRVAWEQIK